MHTNSSLTCYSYSQYAQRMLDSGQVSPEDVQVLSARLPLSKTDVMQLFVQHTPAHHDVEYAVGAAMRKVRVLTMLAMMEFDLTHPPTESSLNAVTRSISALADASVMYALEYSYQALCDVHGEPRSETTGKAMPLWVMGMGKLSGNELNVSSDVDLVFVFEHEGETVFSGVADFRAKIVHGIRANSALSWRSSHLLRPAKP